ncbi:MAG: hypothetical protein MR290_00100 [Ruminococcus sp.]|nr:hypothetical protein [Ruminococcus sp.]
MNAPHTFITNIIPVLQNDPYFENATITTAYENDIKPYPVTKPIIALAMDKHTVGERLISVNEDGSETLSKSRIAESVIKVTFFVPYENGAADCYRWADYLYSYFLFRTELDIVGCRLYDCNYVRECGALVLETDFTLRQKVNE